jgi:hypothetical protein
MAKVKIQGHASGTGVLTVTAPNTSTDRTITLPDATGTLLTTDGSGASLTGISSVGGATGVDFNDNVKARFGTGNDLEMYHDASNSIIKDAGTGSLQLLASKHYIRNADASKDHIIMTDGGAVDIYHNNSRKLITTTTGIDVTGIMTDDRAFFSVSDSDENSGSSGAHHKVEFKNSSIVLDNKSGWDSSNFYWTVPSGQAGMYLIHANVGIGSMTTNQSKARIYINSGDVIQSHFDANNANTEYHAFLHSMTTVQSLSVGDDVWASFFIADGTASSKGDSSNLTIIQLT